MATAKGLESLFASLGIGDYSALIDRAIRNDWGIEQVVARLVNTKAFRQQFPGLIEANGTIANFLTGQQGANVNFQNLATAITNYRTALNEYTQVAAKYTGLIPGDRVTPNMLSRIIRQQVSADEFGARLRAAQQIQKYPQVEAIAKRFGLENKMDLYKAVTQGTGNKFWDYYEAERLAQENLGLSNKQVVKLARGVGDAGVPADIGAIASQARELLPQIGPELEQAGVNRQTLIRWLADPTHDPENIASKVTQALRNRQALKVAPGAAQPRRGPGGGLALYEPTPQASYG